MSTLICRTCKATDFGEGNVGELVCNVCGTELVIGTNDRTEANFAALGAKIYQAKKSKAFVPSADQGNLNNSSRGTSRRKRRKAVASATNLPRTDGMYKQELVGSIHRFGIPLSPPQWWSNDRSIRLTLLLPLTSCNLVAREPRPVPSSEF